MPGVQASAGHGPALPLFPGFLALLHLRLAQLLLGRAQRFTSSLRMLLMKHGRRGPPVGSRTSTLSKRDDTRPMLLVRPMAVAYGRSWQGPFSSSR